MFGLYTFWIVFVCMVSLTSMYCSDPGFVHKNKNYKWTEFSILVRELYRYTAIYKDE
jgi:hypothetical protein